MRRDRQRGALIGLGVAAGAGALGAVALAGWVAAHPNGIAASIDAGDLARELLAADPDATNDELARADGEPTGGAWDFWEPDAQDQYTAKGILYRAAGGTAEDTSPRG